MPPNESGAVTTAILASVTPSSPSSSTTPNKKKRKNRIPKSERKRRKRLREEAEKKKVQTLASPKTNSNLNTNLYSNGEKSSAHTSVGGNDYCKEVDDGARAHGVDVARARNEDNGRGQIQANAQDPVQVPNSPLTPNIKKTKKKKKKKKQLSPSVNLPQSKALQQQQPTTPNSDNANHENVKRKVTSQKHGGEEVKGDMSISRSTSTTVESGNTKSSIVTASIYPIQFATEMSMTARTVDFVFSSKSHSQTSKNENELTPAKTIYKKKKKAEMIPYVHSKLRKSNDTITMPGNSKKDQAPCEIHDNGDDGATEHQTSKKLMDQGIDDILFPQLKKKRRGNNDNGGGADDDDDGEVAAKVGTGGNQNGKDASCSETKRKKDVVEEDEIIENNLISSNKKKNKKRKILLRSEFESKSESKMNDDNNQTKSDAKLEHKKHKRHGLEAIFKEKSTDAKPGEVNQIQPTSSSSTNLESSSSSSFDILRTNNIVGRSRSDSLSDPMKNRLSGRTVKDAIHDESGRRPRSNSTDGELNLPQRGLCDERIVMQNYQWDLNVIRYSHPRGLINLGNTCFLNSTLQCLAYLPTFCQCVANLPDYNSNNNSGNVNNRKTHMNGNGNGNGKRKHNNSGLIMTQYLRNFVRKVHGLDGERKQGPVKPSNIVRSISLLGGGNRGYKFRPGRQEDAHEFLVHLLDAMNNGELKAAGIDPKVSGWRDRLPIPRLDETTLTHRMFGGYLRSQVRCTKCKYNSNTYDPFLDLSLEVSGKKVNSLHDALAEYTRKETLDTANKWKCSGCKKKVCATKQLTIFRPPLTLCIQLKRFSFGGGFGGYMHHQGYGFGHFSGKGMRMMQGGSKIQKPIEFPATLKLPLSDGRKCEYLLTGVVIHVGGSATSGHYTAFVRKAGKQNTTQWYNMDDSYVDHVSEKTVLRHIKDAYVLFYCRKEVQLELPSPPPRSFSNAQEAVKAGEARAKAKSFMTSNTEEKILRVDFVTPNKRRLEIKANDSLKPSATKNEEKISNESDNKTKSPLESKVESDSDSCGDRGSDSNNENNNSDSDGTNMPIKTMSTTKSKESQDTREVSPSSADKHVQNNVPQTPKTQPPMVLNTSPPSIKASNQSNDNKKKNYSLDLGSKKGTMNINMRNLKKNKKNKPWRPSSASPTGYDSNLLGNASVSKWGDEEDVNEELDVRTAVTKKKEDRLREQVFKEKKIEEKLRKRKMYLDSWDASLDAGRVKKVKQKDSFSIASFGSSPESSSSKAPKENPFHRIQQSMMHMKRGKAKGHGNQVTSMKKKRQKLR